jgi:hypothetical protein
MIELVAQTDSGYRSWGYQNAKIPLPTVGDHNSTFFMAAPINCFHEKYLLLNASLRIAPPYYS